MSYITREDGQHFVVPSYRDVLTVKNQSQLKKDILMLSQNYGEYITLRQKGKGILKYEVAFSADTGYLLGESVWDYFKRPDELIYCEAIPNTTEAILVIVKGGSVYLDGSFPVDSIPDELVIFLTQQNNFEIYTHGDVPIVQEPVPGKFSFDANSVKSFTILDKPAFPDLPLQKMFQLQLVDAVLKAHGIGALPVKQIVSVIGLVAALWFAWDYLMQEPPPPPPPEVVVNPYEGYLAGLSTPAPAEELKQVIAKINLLATLPGWSFKDVKYSGGALSFSVLSSGGSVEALFSWAKEHDATVEILQNGFYLNMAIKTTNREATMKIYSIKEVVGELIDRLADVYPGNNIQLDTFTSHGVYQDVKLTVNFADASPMILSLIAEQCKGLPLALQSVTVGSTNGKLSGSIVLLALGE